LIFWATTPIITNIRLKAGYINHFSYESDKTYPDRQDNLLKWE
jgi:hypothetical protein